MAPVYINDSATILMIKVDLRCVMSYVSLVVNLTFNNIQLYREVQFSWLSKPEYMEKPSSTDCKPLTNFIEYTLPWNHELAMLHTLFRNI
jgi:hypothetical protein